MAAEGVWLLSVAELVYGRSSGQAIDAQFEPASTERECQRSPGGRAIGKEFESLDAGWLDRIEVYPLQVVRQLLGREALPQA